MVISRVNHGLRKIPALYRNCPKPGFWVQITVISRVNHSYNTGKSWVRGWKQSPPGIYLQKNEKNAVSRLYVISFPLESTKKNSKTSCFKQRPCLSNQMSRALMSNSRGSLHIRKKLGKSSVLAKNWVFRGKTGFSLPLPVKTEVYSQIREISRVWRCRVYIYIYIWLHMYINTDICIYIYIATCRQDLTSR